MEHFYPILAMLAGVVVHIIKKAATQRAEDPKFSLKDYLIGHPYQTLSLFGAGAGAYFALSSVDGGITLGAAFVAGIAANSMSDAAPGHR